MGGGVQRLKFKLNLKSEHITIELGPSDFAGKVLFSSDSQHLSLEIKEEIVTFFF